VGAGDGAQDYLMQPNDLPSANPVPQPSATALRLQAAAQGLIYSSESDRPLELFFRPAAEAGEGPLSADLIARLAGCDPAEPVEEQDLDRFFLRHVELVDPADVTAWALVNRYDRLKQMMRRELRDLRVVRIGQVRIRCLAAGRDEQGNVVGLDTVAIET
jgi:hypothetical protein